MAFRPIPSTAPSIALAVSTTATVTALGSTQWGSPTGRVIRWFSPSSAPAWANFGSSLTLASSTGSMWMPGLGIVDYISIPAAATFVTAVTTSTSGHAANITLGREF